MHNVSEEASSEAQKYQFVISVTFGFRANDGSISSIFIEATPSVIYSCARYLYVYWLYNTTFPCLNVSHMFPSSYWTCLLRVLRCHNRYSWWDHEGWAEEYYPGQNTRRRAWVLFVTSCCDMSRRKYLWFRQANNWGALWVCRIILHNNKEYNNWYMPLLKTLNIKLSGWHV